MHKPRHRPASCALLFAVLLLFLGPVRSNAEELDCLLCHDSLLKAKNVHPAAEMGCALCHDKPHANDKAELSLLVEPPDLCFQCHDQKAFARKSQHPPVSAGLCATCHNPHASPNAKLLQSAPPALCFQCHDTSSFARKIVHPPVAAGDCLACHEPHSSSTDRVLRSAVGDLCASCHEKQSSGAHVFTGVRLGGSHPLLGRPDPIRPGKELSCLSCHRPHSSDSRFLFAGIVPRPESFCLTCHQKVRIPPQK